MNDARTPRRVLRRVGAVAAGLVTIVVLSVATDAAMYATGLFTPAAAEMTSAHWLLATAYRAVYAILGCWLAARLAPDRPLRHAMALGSAGLVMAAVGVVTSWNRGPDFGPAWYPVAVLALQLPCAWLGGRFHRGSAANRAVDGVLG